MGGSKKQTVGYRYYLGMHKALCHGPVDRLLKIRVDEKTAWEGDTSQSGNRVYVNAPGLFGGDPPEGEGGIQGWLDLELGQPNQGVNGYLSRVIQGLGVAFRGVTCAVLNQVYVGNTPYLKNWGWLLQRIHTTNAQGEAQWYPQYAAINTYDMNPVHIIRECLTNRDWGMGTDVSAINNGNFQTAAVTLFNEGFGLSVLWDSQKPLNEFITDIMEHIDGALYVNRRTGLFEINLIRDNYNPDTIPVLDESQIVDITDYTKPLVGDLTSQVTVQYWDRESLADASVTVQDIALSRQQGAAIATTKQYPAICNSDLANRVAMRDLRTVSTPLIGCTVEAARAIAQDLVIGDVFKMSWPRLGIQEIIMRIVDVDYGTETNPSVTMTVVQDIFAFGDAVYAPTPPTEWEPPVSTPRIPELRLYRSAPYRELVQLLGQQEAEALDPTDEYLLTTAGRPTADSLSVVQRNDSASGGELVEKGEVDFSPFARNLDPLDRMESVVRLSQFADLDLVARGTLAAIGTELVRVDEMNLETSVMQISRGLCDTVPQDHEALQQIVFYDEFADLDSTSYVAGETVRSQLLTKTVQGILDPTEAPIDSYTLVRRQTKPYPAGNVQLNGEYFPEQFQGDINLTWAHRDRIQQADILYDFTAGSIGPEAGVTYDVRIYGDDQLRAFVNDAQGTSAAYSTSDELNDHGNLASDYRFEIDTKRNGEVAFQNTVFLSERFIPLEITQHPEDQTAGIGSQATFTSDALGWVSVAWEVSVNGGVDWSEIAGATQQTYTTPTLDGSEDQNQYRAVYSDGVDTLATNAATLTTMVIADFIIEVGSSASRVGYERNFIGTVIDGVWSDGSELDYFWQDKNSAPFRFFMRSVNYSSWNDLDELTVDLDGVLSFKVVRSGLGYETDGSQATEITDYLESKVGQNIEVFISEWEVPTPPDAIEFELVVEAAGSTDLGYTTSYGSITPNEFGSPGTPVVWLLHVVNANDSGLILRGFNDQRFNGWESLNVLYVGEDNDSVEVVVPWNAAWLGHYTTSSAVRSLFSKYLDTGRPVKVYITENTAE
ncbi:tail assembly protein [Vibrio phage VpKK5]|uniref:tail protein n=1 Tax=Vibrio phage VpKK5 TaxID=1538804 RepID=UPI0004F8B0DB|nr:tail protein [Vibrio phage VpKK5]AIM40624.1 tail assembly protein [Vibrio phage VpKK5]